jgi:dTDP-4-dehydrorhamnose reductase
MKILITGGCGLLGQYLNIELSKQNQILTIYNSNTGNCKEFNSIKSDILNFVTIEKLFDDFNPDVVIHTAAVTSTIPDKSISSKYIFDLNVNATLNIARLCKKFNSKLLYTSTDLVYAGYRGSMLTEDAKLIPVSIYAETKLMGEIKIQETFDNFIILRTALLFGFGLNHSMNHFHKMYKDLTNVKPVKLFIDQFRTPISLIEAARIISELIQLDIKSEIINLGGPERISRYELGIRLCEIAGLDKNLLQQIKMDDIKNLPKVADVSMNTDKLQSLGIKTKSVNEMISEIIEKN